MPQTIPQPPKTSKQTGDGLQPLAAGLKDRHSIGDWS